MAKVGKFCLAKRVKVEWLFQKRLKSISDKITITTYIFYMK